MINDNEDKEKDLKDLDDICDECKDKNESVSQNLILTGFKICEFFNVVVGDCIECNLCIGKFYIALHCLFVIFYC